MYTKIDKEKCISCGACISEAPEVFEAQDDGIAFNKLDDNAGSKEIDQSFDEDVKYAKESCPTDAVLTSDSPF